MDPETLVPGAGQIARLSRMLEVMSHNRLRRTWHCRGPLVCPRGRLRVEGSWRLWGLRRGRWRRGHMPGLGLGSHGLLLLLLLPQLKGLQCLQWRLRSWLGLRLLVLHL